MISGARIVIAKIMTVAALVGLGAARTDARAAAIRYNCSSRDLDVQRSRSAVHVTFDGRGYDLLRKKSSIGEKYLSADAALIIDGATAVFVAEDHFDLGPCLKAVPLAAAR